MSVPLGAIALFERIPERPGPELDRLLDVTDRCLARYGVRRATMTDIAREMGISRPTLYRQVASLEEAIALAGARRFYLFVDELTTLMSGGASADTFIDAAVRAVTLALDYPVTQRILNDEPALIGEIVTSGWVPHYADQIVELLAPVFEAAMADGAVRNRDPRLAAGVMVRLVISCLLHPAGDDLEPLVRCALEPMLDPAPQKHIAGTRR